MRRFISIFCLACLSACTQLATEVREDVVQNIKYTVAEEVVISEFEKFFELELIDCLVAWDVGLYQAEQGMIEFDGIDELKQVMGFMAEALSRKTGGPVDIAKLHPKSSYQISGVYLNDFRTGGQTDAHVEYQTKIFESCSQQMTRIAKNSTLKALRFPNFKEFN